MREEQGFTNRKVDIWKGEREERGGRGGGAGGGGVGGRKQGKRFWGSSRISHRGAGGQEFGDGGHWGLIGGE